VCVCVCVLFTQKPARRRIQKTQDRTIKRRNTQNTAHINSVYRKTQGVNNPIRKVRCPRPTSEGCQQSHVTREGAQLGVDGVLSNSCYYPCGLKTLRPSQSHTGAIPKEEDAAAWTHLLLAGLRTKLSKKKWRARR
jgi:hypothetical protein